MIFIFAFSSESLLQEHEAFCEKYDKFLKLLCMEDKEKHKTNAPLLRFFSSQSNEDLISLDEYLNS